MMKKLVLSLLAIGLAMTCVACQKNSGNMTIENATLIDTSQVDQIGTLIDDKLMAFCHQGDSLFTLEMLNAEGNSYQPISYYNTEFGYIDCTDNQFYAVGQTIPLAGISTFSSNDRRYLYYYYQSIPEEASYPQSQDEYNQLLQTTPTTVVQYDLKKKRSASLQIDVPTAFFSAMGNQKVLVNSMNITVADSMEKPLVMILNFAEENVQLLYDGNAAERESWSSFYTGEQYLFFPDLYDTALPSVRILNIENNSEATMELAMEGNDEAHRRAFVNIGDTFYLYTATEEDPYGGLCKFVPDGNRFQQKTADINDLASLRTYYSQSERNTDQQFFTVSNTIDGSTQYLTIDLDGFTPPPLEQGSLLYPTTADNFILCSGTENIQALNRIYNLESDHQFYFVTGDEIQRALGNNQ